MTCVHCDDLRRQLRELNEELEAWRGNRRDADAAEVFAVRLGRYQPLFKGSGRAAVQMLLLLLDRPGRAVSRAALLEATRWSASVKDTDQVDWKIVDVYLSRLRTSLRRLVDAGRLPEGFAGSSAGIQTHWGIGYSLTVENAAALRQLAGDA